MCEFIWFVYVQYKLFYFCVCLCIYLEILAFLFVIYAIYQPPRWSDLSLRWATGMWETMFHGVVEGRSDQKGRGKAGKAAKRVAAREDQAGNEFGDQFEAQTLAVRLVTKVKQAMMNSSIAKYLSVTWSIYHSNIFKLCMYIYVYCVCSSLWCLPFVTSDFAGWVGPTVLTKSCSRTSLVTPFPWPSIFGVYSAFLQIFYGYMIMWINAKGLW